MGNHLNGSNPTNIPRYTQNYIGGTPLAYNYASSFTKSDFIFPFADY